MTDYRYDKPEWLARLEAASAKGSNPQATYKRIEDLMADMRESLDAIRSMCERVEAADRRARRRENEIRQARDEIQAAWSQAMKRWQIAEKDQP